MHKVEVCCCGCALREGCLIMLWIDVVFYVINLLLSISDFNATVLLQLGILAIEVAALYGVYKEKPSYVIAHMAWQMIGFVFIVFFMVVALIFGSAAILKLVEMMNRLGPSDGPKTNDVVSTSFSIIFLIEILFGSLAGLQYYLFVVMFSWYRKVMEERTRVYNSNI